MGKYIDSMFKTVELSLISIKNKRKLENSGVGRFGWWGVKIQGVCVCVFFYLPSRVSDLTASLSDVNRDDFAHGNGR